MRRVFFLVAFVFGVSGLLISDATAQVLPPTQGFYAAWRTTGPSQLLNLTWSNGEGGLAWGDEQHEDLRPADPRTKEEYDTATRVRAYTGVDVLPARTVTFTSRAAPRDLVLNVTRTIQFELYLKADSTTGLCYSNPTEPSLEVRLSMDGRVIAGTQSVPGVYQYIDWQLVTGSFSAPAGPSGFAVCRLTAGSEVHVIPKGAILKLEVTFVRQDRPLTFGLADDHRSHVRLPLLPAEDILFRLPELGPAPEADAEPSGQMFSMGSLGWAGPLLILGALGTQRGRLRGSLGTTLLLGATAVMGGCLASGGGPPDTGAAATGGAVTNTLIRGGDLVSDATGAIVGVVRDDVHVPVSGVHISIIGGADFTQTNGQGRFQFLGLLPGVYKLRFDKRDYKSFETEIEVQVGFVSRPEVTLYLVNPKERDARPHSHDYWPAGVTSLTLMDATLPTTCSDTSGCTVPRTFRLPTPSKPEDVISVLPGTFEVEVTLTWNSEGFRQPALGLAIQHNGDATATQTNASLFAPRVTGQPFRVATTWEMTDPGHQPLSTWAFHWFPAKTRPNMFLCCIQHPDYEAAVMKPAHSMHVKVVIKRGGALPLEAGHPDHWGTLDQMPLLKNVAARWTTYGYVPPDAPACANVGTTLCYTRFDPTIRVSSYGKSLVPEGATGVEIILKASRATSPEFFPVIAYKPANVRTEVSPQSWKTVQAQPGSTWERIVYKIKLEAGEPDFTYARASSWSFQMRPPDAKAHWQDYTLNDPRCAQNQCVGGTALSYTWNAFVQRTPFAA